MKIIGRIIIKEKGYNDTIHTLTNNQVVEVRRTAGGSSVVVYGGTSDQFLKDVNWCNDYLRSKE